MAVVAAGAHTVNLPDTVGYSTPDEHAALISRMSYVLGESAVVSVHCHNDLGLATANSLAAVQAGRARWNAPSTESANARATARSKRS